MNLVVAGKTKILDNVRRTNVQDGEAGGITQQIGATYVPGENIAQRTASLRKDGQEFELKVPGLLIIDTPGAPSDASSDAMSLLHYRISQIMYVMTPS